MSVVLFHRKQSAERRFGMAHMVVDDLSRLAVLGISIEFYYS